MLSNGRQIIEQTKSTYSPSGKAFENQIKTIEDQGAKQTNTIDDQGERQIKALGKNGKQLFMSTGEKDFLICSKQKEIFDELVNERKNETDVLNEEIDFRNLKVLQNIFLVLKFH